MMFFFYKLTGSFIVPPGLFCIILLICAFLAARKPTKACLAAILLLLSAALWFMSTSLGAALITGPLEEMCHNRLPDGKTHAAVLVLSGGSSYNNRGEAVQPAVYALERMSCAVALAKNTGGPLILSGGNVYGFSQKPEAEIMAACARKMGWKGKIILEKKSRTTMENLEFSSELIEMENIKTLIIVTNAFHMPRAAYCASKSLSGVKLYTYASGRVTDPVFRGLQQLFPEAGSFLASCLGIKEWLGLAAYRIFW